jgi:hypothetical protein
MEILRFRTGRDAYQLNRKNIHIIFKRDCLMIYVDFKNFDKNLQNLA